MTIDAYEPERTVEELRQLLNGLSDDALLAANVCEYDVRYDYSPKVVCHVGDVRWLCEEVLRLRQDLARPRKPERTERLGGLADDQPLTSEIVTCPYCGLSLAACREFFRQLPSRWHTSHRRAEYWSET